ncbi:hypothetical protein EDD17DRAFT_1591160 [Pisolithus thermaeus]|nr:hypothetical protein EDD17DRAFT_1591160 [Pisolithus thermaeus]
MMTRTSIPPRATPALLMHHTRPSTKQDIEPEQRRRDELRDGCYRLKDAISITNQKPIEVSLFDRATLSSIST